MNNEEIVKLVSGWVKWILDKDIKEISESNLCKDFTSSLSKKTVDFINSNEFRSIAYEVIEDMLKEKEKNGKPVKEVLPKGFENMIETQIDKFTSGVNPMVEKYY